MATIAQRSLFSWQDVEELGDLKRLKLVLDHMPDEALMRALEADRGKGRNEYPVRAMWNSVLAGIVFEHSSVESLRRELKRNGQLRQLCGFELWNIEKAVPGPWVYTRFLRCLQKQQRLVGQLFNELVKQCMKLLPEYGKVLAIDGKAISSYARGKREEAVEDGRSDRDAEWGKHTYRGKNADGSAWEQVKSWFGYKVHLIADARYEVPVGFTVTAASTSEMPVAHMLLKELAEDQEELIDRAEYLLADRGYDDGKLISRLWQQWQIKPIIDIRNTWKDPDETKVSQANGQVVYDWKGTVSCVCEKRGTRYKMAHAGFEAKRQTLKYRCPALHYGIECASLGSCPVGAAVRIKLAEAARMFTPVARDSYKWSRLYKKRTSVERLFSRLDGSYGFEQHTIRGLAKMHLRVSLALCIMLALAVGSVKEQQAQRMRSLRRAA